MGLYVNPGNLAFRRIAGKNYVDKTNLIKVMNERVGWKESLLCISRPRRFGKSYAAMMLTAYYDCSCDSHDLFADKRIAESENYEEREARRRTESRSGRKFEVGGHVAGNNECRRDTDDAGLYTRSDFRK